MCDAPTTPRDCACARLCVAAVSGGGGKTLLSLGLAGALREAGREIVPFKKGPDYIDAAWLSLAAGRPARNLDPYFLPPEELRRHFLRGVARTRREIAPETPTLALVEGNRGLYDGLDTRGSRSTAALARALRCPIVLTLDCTKMTRTAAALLSGLASFEPDTPLAGVVLNRTASARHESILRRTIEAYTDLTLFGALPRLRENPLPERHMGLASFSGGTLTPETARALQRLATLVREHVDLSRLLETAASAPALPPPPPPAPRSGPLRSAPDAAARPRIGYVRDAALWFYYEENLEALEQAGADLLRLSLLDPADWPPIDGLYLGGGFPEDWAEALSASPHVRRHLPALAAAGLPIYAECGGFIILTRGLRKDGRRWPLAGILPVDVEFDDRPQGLGYVDGILRAETPYFPLGARVRGHEFHYSRCALPPEPLPAPPELAMRLDRGVGMGPLYPHQDGFHNGALWASYCHIFAPAVPGWAPAFAAAASAFARGAS